MTNEQTLQKSGRTTNAHVARAVALITDRYEEPLTTRSVARALGLERSYLATLFKRETGMTLHGYLIEMRMKRACELLERGEKVEVAALTVGYLSRTAFHNTFKEATGMTPAEWRKRHTQEHPREIEAPSPLLSTV